MCKKTQNFSHTLCTFYVPLIFLFVLFDNDFFSFFVMEPIWYTHQVQICIQSTKSYKQSHIFGSPRFKILFIITFQHSIKRDLNKLHLYMETQFTLIFHQFFLRLFYV